MARRPATRTAELLGGGPADGSRWPVEDEAGVVDVAEPALDGGPGAVLHRYERCADGRYRYAGPVEVPPALLPAIVLPRDAALRRPVGPPRDEAPGPGVPTIVAVVLVLSTLLYLASELL